MKTIILSTLFAITLATSAFAAGTVSELVRTGSTITVHGFADR